MKYYSREIMKRERINSYGKLGFVKYVELFKIDDAEAEAAMEEFNRRKHILFTQTKDPHKIAYLNERDEGRVYNVTARFFEKQ